MDFHEAYADRCSSVGMAARLGKLDDLKQQLQNGKVGKTSLPYVP